MKKTIREEREELTEIDGLAAPEVPPRHAMTAVIRAWWERAWRRADGGDVELGEVEERSSRRDG